MIKRYLHVTLHDQLRNGVKEGARRKFKLNISLITFS